MTQPYFVGVDAGEERQILGVIRRSTRRADSSRSVPRARVIVKTPSCRSHWGLR